MKKKLVFEEIDATSDNYLTRSIYPHEGLFLVKGDGWQTRQMILVVEDACLAYGNTKGLESKFQDDNSDTAMAKVEITCPHWNDKFGCQLSLVDPNSLKKETPQGMSLSEMLHKFAGEERKENSDLLNRLIDTIQLMAGRKE